MTPFERFGRLWRNLSLPWKMAIPPLVMVLVFTPPTFAIVRELSSNTEDDLQQRLERRMTGVHTSILQREFYLLESVRLASNIAGLSEAVDRGDAAAVRSGFTPVLALKDRLDVLAATDRRGEPVAGFVRQNGKLSTERGTDWSSEPLVQSVLKGAKQSAQILTAGGRPVLAVAAPIRPDGAVAGATIAAMDIQQIARAAGAENDTSLAIFDAAGKRVAGSGTLSPRTSPDGGRPVFRTIEIASTDVSVFGEPLNVSGVRVGGLAVAVPRAPFFALANRITRNLEVLIGLAVLAGLVFLVLLTRFLLAQIERLVEANERLRSGNLSARAEVLSDDDLGRVAQGLNAMADELQESHATLERRVQERTRELRVARDAAEKATRAKGDFLASMSHEVRTPMNAIVGMTSLLLDEKLEPRQRRYVETIRASGDHLLTIINDILDFSKIEAGRLELELHPFAVGKSIEEAMDLVAQRAKEKDTELAYSIDDGTPEAILGDMGRLRQVLLNLLSNAVTYTDHGEVVVTVRGRPLRGEKYELQFDVRDTGIGIPKDRVNKLFEAFEQLDASTTRRYGGTGLGLAISKLLVELMGGKIWVDSRVGKGSTFHFTIAAEASAAPQEQRFVPAADLAGRNVLIVDDNETNRHIATRYVERWGMTATALDSGTKALARFRSDGRRFDVALLDERMPGMAGTQLATELKKLRPGLPLILLSSLATELKDRDRRRFASVLTKPIKPSQLHDALQQVFTGRRAVRADDRKPELDPEMARKHPLRVLVAEDNAVNQAVIRGVLERLGYTADLASNGLEAVNSVERQAYDVILMDVSMPEMDGLQATRRIVKGHPESQRPRIIAMTAYATAEDRRRCLAAGMDDYLSKPMTPAKLIEALHRARRVDYSRKASRPKRSMRKQRVRKARSH